MNFTYKHSEEDKVVIKGTLSSDAKEVLVTEKFGDKIIVIEDYLKKFTDSPVEISIKSKSEDDLSDD